MIVKKMRVVHGGMAEVCFKSQQVPVVLCIGHIDICTKCPNQGAVRFKDNWDNSFCHYMNGEIVYNLTDATRIKMLQFLRKIEVHYDIG